MPPKREALVEVVVIVANSDHVQNLANRILVL